MTDVTDLVLDALSAHEIGAFVRCYGEDAKVETGGGETLAFGHTEIRSRYETMFAEFPTITGRKIQNFTVGSYVVQE